VDLPELSLEQGPKHHLDCIHEPEQFWLMNAIQIWEYISSLLCFSSSSHCSEGNVRGSFTRLFPISILLFSWVWVKEIDANGRMLLHLDSTLIEYIKEIDANDPYPKQSKL